MIVCSAESTFGHADPLARVDHLALEVRQVDLVVVDDPERADAGRGQIQRRRRAEAARAEQQHLRVEQLLLALGPDLGEQQMARVALALLGGQRPRRLDLVAAVLPQREARRSSTRRSRSRGPRSASAPPTPSGCRTRSRGPRAASDRGPRPRSATRDSSSGRAWRPGMWPAAHSSGSRTSTTTAPLFSCSRTSLGSTSSIRLLIWRRTSAPDGLIRKLLKAVRIQYFTEYSGDVRPRTGPRDRLLSPQRRSPRPASGAITKTGRPARGAPSKSDPIVLSSRHANRAVIKISQGVLSEVSVIEHLADIGLRPHLVFHPVTRQSR